MKKHIILLVLIPLLFEGILVGVLMFTLAGLSSDLELSMLQYFNKSLANVTYGFALLMHAAPPVMPDLGSMRQTPPSWDKELAQLRQLTEGDPVSLGLVDKIASKHKIVTDAMDDPPLVRLLRFQSKPGLFVSLNADMISAVHALVERHKLVASELSPKADAERRSFKAVMIYGVIANVVAALVFSFSFAGRTIKRLQHLMFNVEHFGVGNENLTAVGGTDEIGLLDQRFREIAGRKLRAERLRKEMMSMVSHDLRSPLTSVRAYLHMMDQNLIGDLTREKVQLVFANVDSELSRLLRLANSLLDVERVEAGALNLNLETHDAANLLEDAFSSMTGSALSKNIALKANILAENPSIFCDGERTVQVLVNLLSNALKYAPNNSEINVTVLDADDGRNLRVQVEDQGPGIAPQDLKVLFERFSQLDQPGDLKKLGAGLGLSLCKTLIERQGGAIGVQPGSIQGTVFWFFLPRSPENKVSPGEIQ